MKLSEAECQLPVSCLKLARDLAKNHANVRIWKNKDSRWWLSRDAMHTPCLREQFFLAAGVKPEE
jgi:hypothetical protein